MKKILHYNYFCQVVPQLPLKVNEETSNPYYKYSFIFKNETRDINGNHTITLMFNPNTRINNVIVSNDSLISKTKENKVTITFNDLKKLQLFKLHLLISNSNNLENIKITSKDPDLSCLKSDDIIIKRSLNVIPLPIKYDFLVASALQEELDPLLKGKEWGYLDEQKIAKTIRVVNSRGYIYNIILYSINKMGMPFNGVAITRIIEQQKPQYVLFIGTCAGLKKSGNLKEGDILIPDYIYSYDSGKYNDKGHFEIEHRHYDVSSSLICLVNDMINKHRKYKFTIVPSCGFCSGASVVSSKEMRNKITQEANRKVLGFDMEAYVIAVINQLYSDVETLVIKGIMDFGENKTDKFKEKAKVNAAKVANDLLNYIIENEKTSKSVLDALSKS